MPSIPLDAILFLVLAAIAVGSAINLVVQTHPINSALSLVGVMISLAVLYLLLGGEFIAAVQVIVYAGAIMVLFVFVIMLLNAGAERPRTRLSFSVAAGVPVLLAFLSAAAYFILKKVPPAEGVTFGGFTGGSPRAVGEALFTRYLLPFEVTSILILIAIIGAIVLAMKEID
ncbi:MAG: NADH-quinone oxidoreductase subunit J [Bryobacterales bacterium]|nr:NADH-quinone oxidoreductase subunit J [Bryobacterales bacterium]